MPELTDVGVPPLGKITPELLHGESQRGACVEFRN
jgi:hypothetical protein